MRLNYSLQIILIIIISLLFVGCNSTVSVSEPIKLPIEDQKDVVESDMDNESNFNYRIIKKIDRLEIDSDGVVDRIFLYFENNKVKLMANNCSIDLMSIDNEEQIFGDNVNDKYIFDLYLNGNKILIGWTYSFVNKYGSSSWLECYEIESNDLRQIWSSEEILSKEVTITNYNQDNNTLQISVNEVSKEMIVDDEDASEFLNFIDFYKNNEIQLPEIELRLIPQYLFYDYDGDNTEELITRTVVTCGASPITDNYISVFEYTSEGIMEVDSWFESSFLKQGDMIMNEF